MMEKEKDGFCFTSSMEPEDYKNYLYFESFKKSPSSLILMTVLSGITAFFLTRMFNMKGILLFLIAWMLFGLVFTSMVLIKLGKQAKNSIFKTEQTISLSETQLHATNRFSEGSIVLPYEQLHALYETDRYLILYFDAATATLIRKRDISADELSSIIRFLKEKLGSRYHLK